MKTRFFIHSCGFIMGFKYVCFIEEKAYLVYLNPNKIEFDTWTLKQAEQFVKNTSWKELTKDEIITKFGELPAKLTKIMKIMNNTPKFKPGDLICFKKYPHEKPRRIISINKDTYQTKLENYGIECESELDIEYIDNDYVLVSNSEISKNNNKMNPPNLTKVWQYQILTNKVSRKFVSDYLNGLGIKGEVNSDYYYAICISFTRNLFSANTNTDDSNFGEVINLDTLFSPEFAEEYKKSKEPKFIEVVLNNSHTAKVYKDKVVVGCQEFVGNIGQVLTNARKKLD